MTAIGAAATLAAMTAGYGARWLLRDLIAGAVIGVVAASLTGLLYYVRFSRKAGL